MRKVVVFSVVLGASSLVGFCLLSRVTVGSRSQPPSLIPQANLLGWRIKSLSGGKDFRDVQFLNDEVGWGVTADGVWRTVDGGQNWFEVRQSPTRFLPGMPNFHPRMTPEGIQFLDRMVGWVVEGDYLIHTSDGGTSWEKHDFKQAIITSCHFFAEDNGWCAGQLMVFPTRKGDVETFHKVVYRTNNGGKPWRLCYKESADDRSPLYSVWANSLEDVWAIGGPLHSTDGGDTWDTVEIKNWNGVSGRPVAIRFLDKSVGWITTNDGDGYLFSSDSGRSWEPRHAPHPFNGSGQRPLVYTSKLDAWAVAGNAVYRSQDTGVTWTKELDGLFESVAFLKDQHLILAVGKDIAVKRLPE